MRFGVWNLESLYRTGSLITIAKELGKYKLDVVEVQEIRWGRDGTELAADFSVFYEVEMRVQCNELETGFFVLKGIISAVEKIEVSRDSMPYVIITCGCDIVVLYVVAPKEHKTGGTKDSFHEELEK
jgi:hypothetical protein